MLIRINKIHDEVNGRIRPSLVCMAAATTAIWQAKRGEAATLATTQQQSSKYIRAAITSLVKS